jgi:hypothetical protein
LHIEHYDLPPVGTLTVAQRLGAGGQLMAAGWAFRHNGNVGTMDCHGEDKANNLDRICAAVVLAGSLATRCFRRLNYRA